MLRVLDLCSGIGGFPLGIIAADLHQAIAPVQFVEIDPYCQSILNKWFPNIPVHNDLKTFRAKPGQYDIITAGFPCQPHSVAGNRKGNKDDRNLWPDIYRIIKESQPIGFIIENVPGIRTSNQGEFLQGILQDIAQAGYDAQWGRTTVVSLGGVHKRERFWLIAYPQSSRWTSEQSTRTLQSRTDSASSSCSGEELPGWTQAISTLRKSDDGLSGWMVDRLMQRDELPRFLKHATRKATRKEVMQPLQALGNAIVPAQVAVIWQKLYQQLQEIY